jgi:hypothetical protein
MKKKKSHTKITIGIILIVILVLALLLLSQRDTEPIPEYSLRNYNIDSKEGYVRILNDIPDSELTKFRCTLPFVNNGKDEYFWRLPNQHDLFDEVDDSTFLTAIHAIKIAQPPERTFLSGRFCETEDRKIILDYYTADRETTNNEYDYYNGHDVEGFITVLEKDGVPGKIIPFIQEDVWLYTGCKPLFQITKSDLLYMSCGVIETYKGSSTLYQIDLQNSKVVPLYNCSYDRMHEYVKTCEFVKKESVFGQKSSSSKW